MVVLRFIAYGVIPVCIFTPIVIYIHDNGEMSLEDAMTSLLVLYLSNIFILYALTGSIRSVLLFTATCKRITDTLLMKEKPKLDQDAYQYKKLKLKDVSLARKEEEEVLENKDKLIETCLLYTSDAADE